MSKQVKRKTYRVVGTYQVKVEVEVKAASEAEAEQIATPLLDEEVSLQNLMPWEIIAIEVEP